MPAMRLRSILIAAALAGCGGSAKAVEQPTTPATAQPEKTLVLVDEQGVGLGGNDPVSYTQGAPATGAADHTSAHGGATYQFASAEAKTAFDADPAKFAPRFGGYCAYAASQNRLSESDPSVFLVLDGQLLMFTNSDFLDAFQKDPAGHKAKAEANWPGLVAKHGKAGAP